MNRCFRNGAPCLFGEPIRVIKEAYWDYYDSQTRSFVFLQCRIHQKFWTPSLLQIEESEKYHSGSGTASYEAPDLQMSDQNGRWMTRSDDPDLYRHTPFDFESKTCSVCDLVCDIRDNKQYLKPDDTCPFSDAESSYELVYWKIEDNDQPCQDFLHPMLLQNIDAINRKRRKAAKAHIWKYLKNSHWMHTLINSGQRMIDVWQRNYQPVVVYYRSLEQIYLYLKTLPKAKKTPIFLQHVRKNLEKSPSYEQLLDQEYERQMLKKINEIVQKANQQ